MERTLQSATPGLLPAPLVRLTHHPPRTAPLPWRPPWRTHSCAMPLSFRTNEHRAQRWGGPPGPQPAPRPVCCRWQAFDFSGEERVQGDPRGPRGSAPPFMQNPPLAKTKPTMDPPIEVAQARLQVLSILLSRHPIHSRRRLLFQAVVTLPEQVDAHVVQQGREPLLPILLGCFAHTVQPARPAFPARRQCRSEPGFWHRPSGTGPGVNSLPTRRRPSQHRYSPKVRKRTIRKRVASRRPPGSIILDNLRVWTGSFKITM